MIRTRFSVLERAMLVSPTETDGINNLKKFLRACLTAHNPGDKKPFVSGTEFLAALNVPAHRWAKEVFTRVFPTLTVPTVVNLEGGAPVQGPDLAALIAAITTANQATAASGAVTTP